ncbi:MAG: hypothetical protein AAFV32_09720, partial [Myxococcota bacterium]
MLKYHRIGTLGAVFLVSGLAQAQSSDYENKRREQVANEEFEQLQTMEHEHQHERREGARPENKTKNRYKNI